MLHFAHEKHCHVKNTEFLRASIVSCTATSIRPLPFLKNESKASFSLEQLTCEQILSKLWNLVTYNTGVQESSLNLPFAVVDSAKSPQSCPVAAVAGNLLLWQDNIVATCVFALFFEVCRMHWSEVEASAFDERVAAWRVASAAPRSRACAQTAPVSPPLKSTHPQWTPSITYRFSTRKKLYISY